MIFYWPDKSVNCCTSVAGIQCVTNAARAIGMLPGHGATRSVRLTQVVNPVEHAVPASSVFQEARWSTCRGRQAPTPLRPRQPAHAPAHVLAQFSAVPLRSTVEQHARELIEEHMLQDTFWIVDLGTVQKLKQDWDDRCERHLVIDPNISRQSIFIIICVLSKILQFHVTISSRSLIVFAHACSLPRVQPHYAVKCNPNAAILATLAAAGASFDCASQHEMQLVLNMCVSPDRIIFAHPCKVQGSHSKCLP